MRRERNFVRLKCWRIRSLLLFMVCIFLVIPSGSQTLLHGDATHKEFSPPELSDLQASLKEDKVNPSFWKRFFVKPYHFLEGSSWISVREWIRSPYLLLVISFLLWWVNIKRGGQGRLSQWALVLAYGLVLGVAFHYHALASSKGPYHPAFVFWVACFLLFLYFVRNTQPLLRPRECWWEERWSRFPYTIKRTILLLLWPLTGIFFQYQHIHPKSFFEVPWYVPMIFWGLGLIFLIQPLLPKRREESNNILFPYIPSIPFSTGSVGEWEEEEASREEENSNHRYWGHSLVIMTILLSAALYSIGNTSVPTDVHGDEAEVAMHAIELRESGQWNIFNLNWYYIPNLFYLIPGWVMWLAGDTLFGVRLSGGLIGIACIPFFYLLACRFMRSMPAALATFLFATSTYMVHFSRMGTGYNQTTLFTLITLYCFVRGLQDSQLRYCVYAGVVCGMGMLSYQATKLLLPLILSSLLLFAFTRSIRWWTMMLSGFCFLLGLWMTISPLVGSYFFSPEVSYARAKSISIFSEEGMEMVRQMYPSRYTEKEIYQEQVVRTLLAPITYKDNSPYLVNYSYGGMLDPVPAIFFVSGMFFLLYQIKNPSAMLLMYWCMLTLITGGMLTNNAPSYQRLTGLIPYLVMIAGVVLYGTLHHISRVFHGSFRMHTRIIGLVLFVLLVMGMHRYFHQIQSVPQMVDEWTRIARYLEEKSPTYYTYFFGAPEVYFKYGTIQFLAPEARGEDVQNPQQFLDRTIQIRGPVSFVLVRSNRIYIHALREKYPGGKEEVHYNSQGRAPFITYEVNF